MKNSEITELQKAEVLIEALPYIQRFNRKIIVVKYGGSAMVDEQLKHQVIQDVVLLKLLRCEKKLSKGEDIGFVGEITKVDPQIIYDLLEKDFLPIICPIGSDEHYASYNINADDAACAIARAVNAEKLAFLTDVEGVYRDFADKSSLISEMTVKEAQDFVNSGSLGGGMLPKLQNCIDAIENGVSRVHILDGRIAHCLLLEIFTNRGIGTAIYKDGDARYFHEEEK